MVKKYRVFKTVEAEQFDGSREMAEKYGMCYIDVVSSYQGGTIGLTISNYWSLDKSTEIHVGDWIVVGYDSRPVQFRDDVFRLLFAPES